MDEFDKIRELSEDLVGRKEPSFSERGEKPESESSKVNDSDDAGLYRFDTEKAPIPTFSFSETEKKDIASMKVHVIALSIFVGIFLVVLIGFFFFSSDNSDEEEIITITATPDPVKILPEQPGGMVIPDQDKLVYNRIRSNDIPTKVEKLFPEPEKPVLPEILIKQEENNSSAVTTEGQALVKDRPSDKTSDSALSNEQAEKQTLSDETPKKEVIQLPKKEQLKESQTKGKKATSDAKKQAQSNPKAVWRVQLLSSSNKTSVEKAWPTILKKNKALLSDMSYDIVTAKIVGKGTFYRLQVGHFSTREMAIGLCAKLKARGQECVPVKP